MANWTDLEKGWVFSDPKTEYDASIKRNCVRITGDFVSGNVLFYILKFFLKKSDGTSKLKIQKVWNDGKTHLCLAKDDKQFELELGTTPAQTKTALKKLVNKGIIKIIHKRFYGNRTRHILLIKSTFAQYYEEALMEQKAAMEQDKERYKDAVEKRKLARETLLRL